MNFLDVLNTKVGDISRPPNMPIGTYRFQVLKYEMKEIESAKGSWDTVDFTLQCIAPTEDVDPDDLQAYGDVSKRQMRHSFMFDKNDKAGFDRTLFGLRRFIEDHLQVDGAQNMELKEALANTPNHQCLATVKWRPDPKDAEVKYDEIGRTAPVA